MKTMVLPALTALKTSGVQSWLGQELELRGIDAVIYTRYILSILLQEDVDEMAEVDIDAGSSFGRKMGYVKTKGKKKGRVDKEELKKTAAVQCLQSVSDQDAGIESLVEELCCRLKELQAQKDAQPDREKENVSPVVEEGEDNSTSPEDQAQRYYEAFPALGDTGEPVTVAAAPTWCAKPEGSDTAVGKNNSKGPSKSSSASSSPPQSATPDNTTPTNKVSHGNKYGSASGRLSRKGSGSGKKDGAPGLKGGGQGLRGRDRKAGKLPAHTARRSKKSGSPSNNNTGTPPFVLPKVGSKRRSLSSSASDHMKSLPLWYTEPVGDIRAAVPARRSEGDYPFTDSATAEMSYWYDGPMFEDFFEGVEAGSRLETEYTYGDSAVLICGEKMKCPPVDSQVNWSMESATGKERELLYDQLCCIDCMHNREAAEGEKREVEGDQMFRRRSGTIVEKCDREHSQSAKEQRTDHDNYTEHCQNAAITTTSHPDISVSLEECHRSMQLADSHTEKQSKDSPNRTEDDNQSESSGSLGDITEAEFEDRYGSKIAPIWGRETPGSESGSIIDTSHLGDRSLFSPVSDRGDSSDAKLHIWRNRPRLGFLSERASPVAKESSSFSDGNATFPRDVFTYEETKELERPLFENKNSVDGDLFSDCADCQQKQEEDEESPGFGAVGHGRQFCFDEETTEKMNSTFPVGRWFHRKRVRRRSSDSYLYTERDSPQVRKLSTNIPMIGDSAQQTEPHFSPWLESSRIEKCEDDFSGYFSDSGYPCPNDLSFLQVGSHFITGGLYGQISMAGQSEVWETPDTESFTPTSAPSPIFSDASSHSRSRFSFAHGSDVGKDDSTDLHSVHSDSEQFADSVVLSSICTEFYKQNVGEEDPYKYTEYGPQNITESCPAFPVEVIQDEAAAALGNGAPVSKLEYHKGESCFTEVKPKAKPKAVAVSKQSNLTHPKPNSYGSFEDEEDLFVSSRTHFKPITSRETSPDECYHSDGTEILEEDEDVEEAVIVDNIFSTPPETVEEIVMVQSVEEPSVVAVEEPLIGDICDDLLPQLRKLSFEKSSQTSINDVGTVQEPDVSDFSPILDVMVLSQEERTSPDGRESFDEDKDIGTEKDQLPPPPPNLWENVPLNTEDPPQSSQGMLSVEISGTWMTAAKPWSTEVDDPQELGSLDHFGEAIGGLLLDVASPHATFPFPDIEGSDPEDVLPLPLPVGEERSTRLYERGCCQQGTI